MTQVAQKIDDENRELMKKNQEYKIQFLSQENDRDLLLRQLIFHKKENQKIRETHAKMKAQVDKIKQAEMAEDMAKKLEEGPLKKGLGGKQTSLSKLRNFSNKPGTAGANSKIRM